MSELWIYDSKQRKKRLFEPLDAKEVKVYVCGPTVYDRAHIGNGLSAVVFDVLVRLLRAVYPRVKYVRNITDVDDKINKRAFELGISISQLTKESTTALNEDFDALLLQPPDQEPRATEHIAEIIEMIQCLIDRGHAYEEQNHVLFYVPSDPNYGSLSNRTLDELVSGARVEVAPYKRDPKDFVLWKPSSSDLPGWESPWGRGRPGWHIECSAMIRKHLGHVIDIHGGGSDLVFPHHENEMAQSTCLQESTDYVRYWMHNGMLQFGSQKMAKSLGNIQTIHELLKEHSGEVLRYALLSGHYRQALQWDSILIQQSERSLNSFYTALRKAETVCGSTGTSQQFSQSDNECFPQGVMEPLLDDLNTPRALAAMHELTSQINQCEDPDEVSFLRDQLLAGGWLLGLLDEKVESFFQSGSSIEPIEIEAMIERRNEAKKAKNFELADSIRDELSKQNIVIEDTLDGTTWRTTKSSS